MIHEAQAIAFLQSLPEGSFVRNWAHYATFCTDAPVVYHIGCALAGLAAVAPPSLMLSMGQKTYGTIWMMLVGESGTTKKTTAINLMEDAIRAVCPLRQGSLHGSVQSFYEGLESEPIQLVVYGEFGVFLSQSAQKGSPLAPLRDAWMGAWDCRDIPYKTVKKMRHVRDPRFSLLVGCAPGLLEENTTSFDWENGFTSRWTILYSFRERCIVIPRGHQVSHDWCITRLAALFAGGNGIQPCQAITPEAADYYDRWFRQFQDLCASATTRSWAKSPMARVHTVALKAAILLSFDFGAASRAMDGRAWALELPEMIAGIAFAELHLASMLGVVGGIGGSIFGRARRAVMATLTQGPLLLGEIIARCQPEIPKKQVIDILDSTCEACQTWKVQSPRGMVYMLIEPEIPEGSIAMFNLEN